MQGYRPCGVTLKLDFDVPVEVRAVVVLILPPSVVYSGLIVVDPIVLVEGAMLLLVYTALIEGNP